MIRKEHVVQVDDVQLVESMIIADRDELGMTLHWHVWWMVILAGPSNRRFLVVVVA